MNRGYSTCRWINSSGFWDGWYNLHVFITYNNVQCTIVVYQ